MSIPVQDLQARRDALLHQLAEGRRRLEELEKARTELQHQMLRISGAVQVLEELLSQQSDKD